MKNSRSTPVNTALDLHELVVLRTKARKLSLLLLVFFMVAVFDGSSKVANWSALSSFQGGYSLQVFLLGLLALIFILTLYRFFGLLKASIRKVPAAVLNKQGLWLEHIGLVPWENIGAVEAFVLNPVLGDEGMRSLGIRFKDPEIVLTRRWTMRLLQKRVHSSTTFHLVLNQLDSDCQHVAQFAQKYIH